MIDKTRMEREALEHAVRKSGEFIELLMAQGYTSDMATWTHDAYATFIEETVSGFVERLQEIKVALDADPLSDVIPY